MDGLHWWGCCCLASLACGLLGEAQGFEPEGTSEYGMQIFWVEVRGPEDVQVTTTGALFQITPREVRFFRLIDPATNDVAPREVARMEFGSSLGPLSLGPVSKRSCVIQGAGVTLDIRSDSLMFIANPSDSASLAYVYRSLIPNAPWGKGSGADRMWTDGGGGTLHLSHPRAPVTASAAEPDGMRVTIGPKRRAAVAVFPPKKFDFEKLYGREARPHVYLNFFPDKLDRDARILEALAQRGYGVFCLFHTYYVDDPASGGYLGDRPLRNPETQRAEYRFKDPAAVDRFISAAHAKGFKVIAYFSAPGFRAVAKDQPIESMLSFMREFQQRHHLNGWYFDNAALGDWLETYNFIRQVWADVGKDGVIYHHDTVDVWGGLSGLVMVPVDAYADYTVKGEGGPLAEVHTPNDPAIAYYTGGYGLSQAIPCHIVHSRGGSALTCAEIKRLLGENLNGSVFASNWWEADGRQVAEWDEYYRPFYEARRQQYLSGPFSPRIHWPVDWFRQAQDVKVETSTPTSAQIEWRTDQPATGQIRYTTTKQNDFRDRETLRDPRPLREHQVLLHGLEPGTTYRFAIRSSNGARGDQEVIWGYVGTFETPKTAGEP
ncbi:MAG: fibronectin type III domain-containing protein [Planctomycetota bacterium]